MKINFIYPLDVDQSLPKLILISLGAGLRAIDTVMLSTKAKPSLKKLKIVADGTIKTRVSYSPLTGIIKVSPSVHRAKHRYEGVVPNVLLALGMGYYDFGLSKNDQLYWKNLTRGAKIDRQLLQKSSFNVEQAGKPRLLFGSEMVKELFYREKSELIHRFFDNGTDNLIELSKTRFRSLGVRKADRETMLATEQSLYETREISLADALDVSGITGISDFLKERGYQMQFDYDSSGVMELKAVNKEGVNIIQMKRSFHDGVIRNDYFAIHPELQRQGLGMKAFATQLMSAVKHDIKEIQLTAEKSNGVNGYDVWWRFGFDGMIESSNIDGDIFEAEGWWKQAVVEKILMTSEMSSQIQFYTLIQELEDRVSAGEFSPSAFSYFMDRTLDGEFDTKKDFETPSKKDFMSLVDFFNQVEPNSMFLKEHDLSYKHQRIQRLMEIEGFSDWWTINGGKWEASLDLSEGVDSPVIGMVRQYMKRRGL